MTEQEKKELLDELEKRVDEKYKGCLTREDVAATLKAPREKWFRDENGNGRYSLMADAFDSTIISWRVWETIRKLTCVVCGKASYPVPEQHLPAVYALLRRHPV